MRQSLLRPLAHFLHTEAAGGVVLLLATAAALAAANSPAAEVYHAFWHGAPEWFVNDGLMTLFFFVVGLEIKRELVAGELRDPRHAALPAAAALGGMVVPALLYFALQRGTPGERGWGVPMATDIAFVVGVLALLGPRVPSGLKVLLLSLAIVDDLGAVLVIAVAYTSDLSALYLGLAAGGLLAVWLALRAGVRPFAVYVALGVLVWLAIVRSGVHPTVAGVALGLMTPAPEPLGRLEKALHPWVAFGIMPLFALANAGVAVRPAALADPVAVAVALGLLVGKPAGIVLFSALAVRSGVARMPAGVNRWVLVGAGCLGGIGFTMSLFISALAFARHPEMLATAKAGTLAGSALSAALGSAILLAALPRPPRPAVVS